MDYDEEKEECDWAKNYKTARERHEMLEEKVCKDVELGRMIKMSRGEARAKFGEKFLTGALGLVEDGGGMLRLIHDGTHKVKVTKEPRARQPPGSARERHLRRDGGAGGS